jgi:hypothetical protein
VGPTDPDMLGWRAPQSATVITFWRSARGYHRCETKNRMVRFKKHPFASGSIRSAYYFQDVVSIPLHLAFTSFSPPSTSCDRAVLHVID